MAMVKKKTTKNKIVEEKKVDQPKIVPMEQSKKVYDVILANLIVLTAVALSTFIPVLSLALPVLVFIYLEVGLYGFIYNKERGVDYKYEDLFLSLKKYVKFFQSESRISYALWGIFVSFTLTALLGCIAFAVNSNYWHTCKLIFFMFTAPGFLSAILLMLTAIPEDYSFHYGAGLYYGTLGVAALIRWLWPRIENEPLLMISAVISSLIAYIVYIKQQR